MAAAAAAQTMPGMAQGAAYGQVQNPFMGGFYPNQPFVGGGPMVQETRRFLGGYGYGKFTFSMRQIGVFAEQISI